MNVEVLVSAMNLSDFSLVYDMNIKTNTVIINQCKDTKEELKVIDENIIRMYYCNEVGVGKSRNTALMKASGDICIVADDDVIYVDNYEELILDAFDKYKDADIIIFNVQSLNKNRPINFIKKEGRVNYLNFMRHGACRMAFRRESILKSNVHFSLLFGGGCRYGSGEDSLFLYDCLRRGLKIYTYTPLIAYVKQETSSWYSGINEKLYFDRGALYCAISHRYCYFISLILSIKMRKGYKQKFRFIDVYKMMLRGISDYKK